MVKSEEGYVPDSAGFRILLDNMSGLYSAEMPKIVVEEFQPLLDSSNIAVKEWNKIGEFIEANYDEYDGFVVLHGTDTMAYTASALSFALENLGKPVIFTGSQIPLCEVRTDGRENIINSAIIACSEDICEVCIYFDGKLLRGNRSTKRSADQFTAFDSPNEEPLAFAGIKINYDKAALLPKPEGKFRFQHLDDLPIGVIKVFPGIQFDWFAPVMTERLKGIVLETFGAGNIPSLSQNSLMHIIEKAYKNGTIITVCSQCMEGAVSLGAYQTSQALHDIGAVDGKNMTTEAALAKLYYLNSKGYDTDKIKRLMSMSLRGELN